MLQYQVQVDSDGLRDAHHGWLHSDREDFRSLEESTPGHNQLNRSNQRTHGESNL